MNIEFSCERKDRASAWSFFSNVNHLFFSEFWRNNLSSFLNHIIKVCFRCSNKNIVSCTIWRIIIFMTSKNRAVENIHSMKCCSNKTMNHKTSWSVTCLNPNSSIFVWSRCLFQLFSYSSIIRNFDAFKSRNSFPSGHIIFIIKYCNLIM